jgi:hypothetical protein
MSAISAHHLPGFISYEQRNESMKEIITLFKNNAVTSPNVEDSILDT